MKGIRSFVSVLFLTVIFGFSNPENFIDGNVEIQPQRFAPQSPFNKGEKIKYLVHYGLLNAGEATLSVKNQDTSIDGQSVYHMVGEGKTLSIFEWFYKVRDVYETYVDEDSYGPRKFRRRVNEGGYIINRDYHFMPEHEKVHTLKKGDIKTPKDVQDMLSSFYYLRALDFSNAKPGDMYRINAFMDYEMWPFYVQYKGREEIKIGMGKYKCMKFVPVVQEGRVFKSEDDLEIWVSDDANKVPILVKANIIVGSVKAELIGHKNLAAPLVNLKPKKDNFWD